MTTATKPRSTTTRKRKPSAAAIERAKATHAEKVEAANADLLARLERMAADPIEWLEFIETVAAWGARYSFGNQVLLLMQCELRGVDPEMFLPYGQRDGSSGWLREGRQVRKGSIGYDIWAPLKRRPTEAEAREWEERNAPRKLKRDDNGRLMQQVFGFRFAKTFELGQTEPQEGKPDNYVVPTVEVRRRVKTNGGAVATLLTGDDPTGVYADVVKLIEAEGYTYELTAPGKGYLGKANGVTVTGPKVRKVQVRDDVSDAQRIKTAIHELAHIKCGHTDPLARLGENMHRGRKETEAESVAHIVCKAFGLDSQPYTDAYVLGWADGDMDLVRSAAEVVVNTAREIVDALAPMAPFKSVPAADTETEEDTAA